MNKICSVFMFILSAGLCASEGQSSEEFYFRSSSGKVISVEIPEKGYISVVQDAIAKKLNLAQNKKVVVVYNGKEMKEDCLYSAKEISSNCATHYIVRDKTLTVNATMVTTTSTITTSNNNQGKNF